MKLGNRGQVSAELIIVIAALLAVALVFISSLNNTVKDASKKMGEKSKDVLGEIDQI